MVDARKSKYDRVLLKVSGENPLQDRHVVGVTLIGERFDGVGRRVASSCEWVGEQGAAHGFVAIDLEADLDKVEVVVLRALRRELKCAADAAAVAIAIGVTTLGSEDWSDSACIERCIEYEVLATTRRR